MSAEGDDLGEVLSRARSGDETAFGLLWDSLHPRLLRYLRVLGCDEADDVASETWLQAVRDLRRFDGGADEFRCWLFTIGRHRGAVSSPLVITVVPSVTLDLSGAGTLTAAAPLGRAGDVVVLQERYGGAWHRVGARR